MYALKNDIITKLEKEILPLQGLKKLRTDNNVSLGFDPIENAFPNSNFPIGCTHEFISKNIQDSAAAYGFVAALIGKLSPLNGSYLWISNSRNLFPPALKQYNVHPEQVIFIDLKNEKDVLCATEEALKCNKLTAVLAEVKNISFKASRRLQLAAEQSRVTGFIFRNQPQIVNTIASVSRWRITSLPSALPNGMPGIGFPRWKVELLKVRNGTPGSWIVEWSSNNFKEIKKQQTEKVYELRKIS